ncbi:flagellar hook-length control protein FliK [Verticiella sediminum]|uniref:Flagellar hook-length control protein FliK n=1 Tax=Verticiella sediminum TaxID=1247510 RepID=A0A556ARU2_9BURK|nr:flagellar hook-length control protein FliK [Verticiella sediminum]TSH95664.1 flagellar hook-length control protein FliK [Verticiella sediminum]
MNIAHAMAQPAAPAEAGTPAEAKSGDGDAFGRLLREQRGAQATDSKEAAPDAPAPRAADADVSTGTESTDTAADTAAQDSDVTATAHAQANADAAETTGVQAWIALAARAASDAQAIAAAPPSSALADQVRSLTELSRAWSMRGLAIPAQPAGRVDGGAAHAPLMRDAEAAGQDIAPFVQTSTWRAAGQARPGSEAPPAPAARRSADTTAAPNARVLADPAVRQAAAAPLANAPAGRAPAAGAAVAARTAQRTPNDVVQAAQSGAADADARATVATVNVQGNGAAATAADAPAPAAPQAASASPAGIAGLAPPVAAPAAARADAALPGAVVQTTLPAPVGSAQFAPALGQQLVTLGSAGNGVRHAEMRLDPPELGPLRVSLSLQGDQASAVFLATHPATRQAIEAALPQLQQQLADAGIQLGQSSVGDQQAFEQHARQAQGGTGPDGDTDAGASAEPTATSAMAAPRGLVDTFA